MPTVHVDGKRYYYQCGRRYVWFSSPRMIVAHAEIVGTPNDVCMPRHVQAWLARFLQAVPQGRWLVARTAALQGVLIRCSLCRDVQMYSQPTPRYCGNCGARMENSGTLPEGWLALPDKL